MTADVDDRSAIGEERGEGDDHDADARTQSVYERATRVRAPLERVWAFHSRIEGLEALTPAVMHLQVESVTGPDGTTDPAVMTTGTRAVTSVRPFGVGPRQRVVSDIVERERADGTAYFVDEMAEGPFPVWRHTHAFYADGPETIVRDRVVYRLPGGRAGRALGRLGVGRLGFEPMFRYRHRRTRALLKNGADGPSDGDAATDLPANMNGDRDEDDN